MGTKAQNAFFDVARENGLTTFYPEQPGSGTPVYRVVSTGRRRAVRWTVGWTTCANRALAVAELLSDRHPDADFTAEKSTL